MTDDLYSKLICALTHDMHACAECGKCGETYIEARMNLIRELAAAFGKELPWEETEPKRDFRPIYTHVDYFPGLSLDDLKSKYRFEEFSGCLSKIEKGEKED